MDFFLKKNATLPLLKLQVINNGRSDFDDFMNTIETSSIFFSMVNVDTGIPKITTKPAGFVEKTFTEPNSEPEYYVYYQFTSKDTDTVGKFEGQFLLRNDDGTLVLPIRETLNIYIQDSFIANELGYENPYVSEFPCCNTGPGSPEIPPCFTGGTVDGYTVFTSGLSSYVVSAITYQNLPPDIHTTGGTYDNNTGIIVFSNTDGNTFSVSGLSTGYTLTSGEISSVLGYTPLSAYTDTYVTGVTYSNNTFTYTNNTGGTFDVSFENVTGLTVNGIISATTMSATTLYGDGSNLTGISTQDTYVTGGTYSNGTTIFTNNTGGTFNVDGYFTPSDDIYVTGFTFNPSNYDITILRNDGVDITQNLSILSADVTVTGGTYDINTGIVTFTNNSGGTFTVSGFTSGMTDSFTTSANLSGNTIWFNNNQYGNDFYSVDLSPILTGASGNSMFTVTTGLTANVTHTIEHNLNTENILIQIISSDGKLVLFSNVSNYQLNSVDVETTVTDTYTINIIGNGNVTLITGGTGTDSYTNNAYLSGNTIVFDNNIYGSDFYNVDLTPVLTGSSSISKFVTTSALTANVVTTISHTINSDDVIVQIKNSSGEFVLLDTINNYQPYSVDIVSSVSGTFKIIIIG